MDKKVSIEHIAKYLIDKTGENLVSQVVSGEDSKAGYKNLGRSVGVIKA